MSDTGSGGDDRGVVGAGAGVGGGAGGGGGADAGPGPEAGRSLHARSFKLRFAANREQGRSYVSLVKPLALPATVTNKFYSRVEPAAAGEGEEEGTGTGAEARALRRIQDMFERGPRDVYLAPVTTSHQYGWWWQEARRWECSGREDRRLHHHIRDSPWLKARLLVLAADDKINRR